MKIATLIIHYNNSKALTDTLERMSQYPLDLKRITVLDNHSERLEREAVEALCADRGVGMLCAVENLGWGAAINYFLSVTKFEPDELLMIAAHDALIESYDEDELAEIFADDRVAIACPQYPKPINCHYSVYKSFYCCSGFVAGEVLVGHGTACLVRPEVIRKIRYDEECFIYGCEFEIFLRVRKAGYRTIMTKAWVVRNPKTDSPANFSLMAYTINSIYISRAHFGMLGYVARFAYIMVAVLFAVMRLDLVPAIIKARSLWFSIQSMGGGFRRYYMGGDVVRSSNRVNGIL